MTRRIRVTMNAGALTALAVALIMMLANLGGPALVQPDEGRNAEVAREMAASGEWLVPSFNGLTYLDKPAFYFDLVAVSLKTLGNTETAARLPSALFGLLLTGMVWLFCRREYGEPAAALAAMVVASSPMVFVFARSVIFDIALTFFVCAAILCGYLGAESEGRRRSAWFALGAAAAGAATLVKGPVGAIVPAIVLAVFLWIDGKRRAILRIVHPLNLAVFLALVLPWFLALVRRYPDFLEYGLLRESLDRLTKPVFERGGPWYYYLPVLAGALFPWTVLLPESVAAWWRNRHRLARADRFFAVWAAAVFLFFSLSRTKHPGYVLPGVVALGALLGRCFSLALSDPRGRAAALVRRGAVALAAVALAACALLAVEAARPGGLAGLAGVEPARARWVAGAVPLLIGALLLVGGLALAGVWRRDPLLVFAACLLLPVALVTVLAGGLAAYTEGRSHRALALRLEQAARGAELASLECFPSGAPFYLQRTLTLITSDGNELRSNYAVYSLARTKTWPPSVVRLAERDAWLASRRGPVYLLVDRGGRDFLASQASARGSSVDELAPGWWGALLRPAEGN